MFELMLDTANLEEIKRYTDYYPVSGITTNPTILKAAGKIDFFKHLAAIRDIIGQERSLHVQVVSHDCQGIIDDAQKIMNVIGEENTYIKIPVNEEGLKAIKELKARGVRVTATAVYTAMQGFLALLAGADYIAVYYNRLQSFDIDPSPVVSSIAEFIVRHESSSKILAASFKNSTQVLDSISLGADSATVPVSLLSTALSMPAIGLAISDFEKDWESIHGVGSKIPTL